MILVKRFISPTKANVFYTRFVSPLISLQALEFNFYKYGQPDPEHTLRDIDMSLKLRMAKVRYVYTHRFTMEVFLQGMRFLSCLGLHQILYAEFCMSPFPSLFGQVISFLDHFNKLQVVLGRMRAHEDGRRLTSTGQCGARIDLGKHV